MGAVTNVNWRNATPEKSCGFPSTNFLVNFRREFFWNFSGVPRPTRSKALLTKIRTLRR